MILLTKHIFLIFCCFLILDCVHSPKYGQQKGLENHNKKNPQNINFLEVRRLNLDIDLKEYTVINSALEIRILYEKLHDSRYSRSVPIPAVNKEEYFLVLKPKLSKIEYGDIEVEKVERKDSLLNVYYREVGNYEYAEQKKKDPILILKIFEKPKNNNKINLMKNNL